ncbi:hypothetical protein [Ureaplasma canigenitalium]|uniref:hypothetical protein n=1 Tax=Ureaplasma canigenitalium TaxID=42092 RepID=UPI0004E19E5E|nr:hypothetical protein [Ureaplasma canigenitalium]
MENSSNSTIKKINNFSIRTIKQAWIFTGIGFAFILIALVLIIYSGINLNHYIQISKTVARSIDPVPINLNYDKEMIFTHGSVVGVSIFVLIMIIINLGTFWSYSNVYIPELKETILLKNWYKLTKKNENDKRKKANRKNKELALVPNTLSPPIEMTSDGVPNEKSDTLNLQTNLLKHPSTDKLKEDIVEETLKLKENYTKTLALNINQLSTKTKTIAWTMSKKDFVEESLKNTNILEEQVDEKKKNQGKKGKK